MAPSERTSVAVLSGISLGLGGVVVYDAVEDWLVEGNALWTTALENAVPLALIVGLVAAAVRLATDDHGREYASVVTKWTVVGTGTMLLVAAWVVGLQVLQGQLKPRIIVIQTTVVGAVAGLLVGRNTAEIRRAREAVRREKNRFESLFENDPAPVADLRYADGRLSVASANRAFEARFDGTEGRLFDLVPEDESTREAIRRHVKRGEIYASETRLDTADGPRHFAAQIVPYGLDGNAGEHRAYAIYQDITDLKETERRLERTVGQLEKSNEQLQQFAYVASHDLQEPLRMVSSYVDLLAAEYEDELDEEADEYIEFAVDGAERMQEMIDDLLQYSRVRTEAGEFTETDAEAVFDRVRRDLELLIEEENATVTSDDLPTVTADENQLAQVFQNLVANAIEHGGDGEEPPSVHVGADPRPDEVVFSVTDNGPGIPDDQQERVFEIFEQATRESEGTGIGLAICRRIVNRHGGDIRVDSSDDEGTTIRFSVPRDVPRQSTATDLR